MAFSRGRCGWWGCSTDPPRTPGQHSPAGQRTAIIKTWPLAIPFILRLNRGSALGKVCLTRPLPFHLLCLVFLNGCRSPTTSPSCQSSHAAKRTQPTQACILCPTSQSDPRPHYVIPKVSGPWGCSFLYKRTIWRHLKVLGLWCLTTHSRDICIIKKRIHLREGLTQWNLRR